MEYRLLESLRKSDLEEDRRAAANVDERQALKEKAIVEVLRTERECRGDNHWKYLSTCCAMAMAMDV